jgi:NAD(P)-dependent dehydrogenase (short-subunit alcohol dehydrogenase family)
VFAWRANGAIEVADGITSEGGRALAVHMDVSDETSVADLFKSTIDHFGGVDSVHANAADLSPATIGGDTDAVSIEMDTFDHILAVNLRGHVLCTRYAVPALLDRGGGSLVYTASAAAFLGESTRPAYAITKAGICALVRHVASKWGKDRIRANAIAPGLVVTPMIAAVGAEEILARSLRHTRSWRLGDPADIAAMVTHLMSDEGEWINGQVISVDGGTVLR